MCKNALFDRSVIKLFSLELFLRNKFLLYRYKTGAVSVSNTGKQQVFANQRIHRLSDKDHSVPNDINLYLVFDRSIT